MPDRALKRGRSMPATAEALERGASRAACEPSPQPELEATNVACGTHNTSSPFRQIQSQLPNQAYQQDPNSYFPPPGKMLLPRLVRASGAHYVVSQQENSRTVNACNTCRQAKAKCSGEIPCKKCRNEDKLCIYDEAKKDKDRKKVEWLVHQNRNMEQGREQLMNNLYTLASNLPPDKRRELEDIIGSSKLLVGYGDNDHITSRSFVGKDHKNQDFSDQGEDDAGAEVGSPGSLDLIHEDINRNENTRAAGFMGKSSAVTWVQRAKKAAANDVVYDQDPHTDIGNAAKGSFMDATYHAKPSSTITVEMDEVDPFEWPTPLLAKTLIDLYFEHVHDAFPILCKKDFYVTLDSYSRGEISKVEDHTWLSLANMIFAIGAIYAHVALADYRGDKRDHHVFYARARALGMDERSLGQDPELQHTSCLGLLGLYLLVADQLNRSWTICGIALRHATALGLHVRSEASELSDMDKELRVRLWWSLYSLERVLDVLTGRPSCISDGDISTPFPLNIDEADICSGRPLYESRTGLHNPAGDKAKFSQIDLPTPVESTDLSQVPSQQSVSPIVSPASASFSALVTRLSFTSSAYFISRVRLSIISHEILSRLYSASLVKAKWSTVENAIRQIDARLLQWKSRLPVELDFSSKSPLEDEKYGLHRASLEIFYNSLRLILFRPCLCQGRIERQSEQSKSFDSSVAIACVQSARNIIAALPKIEDPRKVYKIIAWWNTIHYIIEAASVLMLELAYRVEHIPSQAEDILRDSKTAVMWLRALSAQSIAARKGWEVFRNLLETVAPKVGGDTRDMPTTAPDPPGWKTTSEEGRTSEVHDSQYGQQREGFVFDPSRISIWMDQSTHAASEAHAAPVLLQMTSYNSANGVPASFLTPPYSFNQMYSRYDAYPGVATPFYPITTYSGTTGFAAESLGVLTSQIDTMGPYQHEVMTSFPENNSGYLGTGEQGHDTPRYYG